MKSRKGLSLFKGYDLTGTLSVELVFKINSGFTFMEQEWLLLEKL